MEYGFIDSISITRRDPRDVGLCSVKGCSEHFTPTRRIRAGAEVILIDLGTTEFRLCDKHASCLSHLLAPLTKTTARTP